MNAKSIAGYLALGIFAGGTAAFYFTGLNGLALHADGAVADTIVGLYVLALIAGPITVLFALIWYLTIPIQVDGRAALRIFVASVGYCICISLFVFLSLGRSDL